MVIKTSDRRWQMLWACVVAVWLAAGLRYVSASETPVPIGGDFVRWCQNEASSAEYILWLCFLYV